MKKFVSLAFLLFSHFALYPANAALTAGKEYVQLAAPRPNKSPKKTEIIEFFSYSCPHCFTIEPYINLWAKRLPSNVNFQRVHIIWAGGPVQIQYAKIYYTLEAMDLLSNYQLEIFKAIQKNHISLHREETLFTWIANQGIDVNKFKETYYSFGVQSQVNNAQELTKRYKIEKVPSFVVNGQYLTSLEFIGKADRTIVNVLNELITLSRQSK